MDIEKDNMQRVGVTETHPNLLSVGSVVNLQIAAQRGRRIRRRRWRLLGPLRFTFLFFGEMFQQLWCRLHCNLVQSKQ